MARPLPQIGADKAAQLENAWQTHTEDWQRQRLLVIRLVAQHALSAEQIAQAVGISRMSVFRYLKLFQEEGAEALLVRKHGGGRKSALNEETKPAFLEALKAGEFRRAKEAQAWIAGRTGRKPILSGVYKLLGKVGGVLKVPRKLHAKKDAAKAEAFKASLADKLQAHGPNPEKVRVWVLDEHRYGLLPVIRRCWSLKGVRVHVPYATKYEWGYLHEAMEVDGENKIELLFTPGINQDWHLRFLEQISQLDSEATHVIIADQAGFHLKPGDERLPKNIRLEPLPPYSPELNPVEKLGDLVKDAICNRLYPTLEAIEQAVLKELEPMRTTPSRVAELIGEGWLSLQVNAGGGKPI